MGTNMTVIEGVSTRDAYANVDNIAIRYWDSEGNGPVLFCCGGVGSSVEIWHEQFKKRPNNLRIIAWDYPSHGLSGPCLQRLTLDEYAGIAWKLIDKLAISEVHLIGNSMGGAVSLRMLAQRRDKVKSIGLLNCATLGRDTPIPFRLMTLPGIGRIITKAGETAYTNQINTIFHQPQNISESILSAIKRNSFSTRAQLGFLKGVRCINSILGQRKDLVNQSKHIIELITCPIWGVHGEYDRVLPVHQTEQIYNWNTNANINILRECGHTPQAEKPIEINEMILAAVFSYNSG